MPATILLAIPPQKQEQMLAALRRARYGYLLALHILLLCARGRNPTAIAAVLFCSRSSVYRVVRLYRTGQLGFTVDADAQLAAPCGRRSCCPWCSAHWLRCSRPHPGRMAGAVRSGDARR